ncbi:MAG: Stp1/IreP family PP2C-type Ser/Thr phosphatase [Syntrophaceae bacterium]|nr:Stp1/IreP family PP2C-type Ser/Thr phosphatase [Syntrophaceae bacterium]NTW76317.1 Stp1/IreP family PP2C-type Ser/Thr phosphatase [Syntrophaceae bacterium]
MDLTAVGKTDRGLVRVNNEDEFYLDEKLGLLVVADGMGGHASGEVASKLAVNVIRDYFQGPQKIIGRSNPAYSEATNKLNCAIRLANQAVYEVAQSSPVLKGMGTTIVAVLLTGNKLSIAHIGDSRAYLLRAGNIDQLTDDHTMVNEQVRRDIITKEEADRSEMKNVLTKALGISAKMEADLDELTMFGDDILFLCTDGLNTMVTDEDVLKIISHKGDFGAACDLLINAANKKGGKDNITVVIGHINKKKWYAALFKFLEFFRR